MGRRGRRTDRNWRAISRTCRIVWPPERTGRNRSNGYTSPRQTADIRGFFDTLDHEWLVKFVEQRIADPRVVRHLQKWLNAGVMEDGKGAWNRKKERRRGKRFTPPCECLPALRA